MKLFFGKPVWGLLATACLLSAACSQLPVYPPEPVISLKSFEYQRNVVTKQSGSNQLNDTANYFVFKVNYRDGDGDLGLYDNEYSGSGGISFRRKNADSSYNVNYWNFVVDSALQANPGEKTYTPNSILSSVAFGMSGRFPRIADDNRAEPVKGVIEYDNRTAYPYDSGTRFKVHFYITDRALHHSNGLWAEVVIGK